MGTSINVAWPPKRVAVVLWLTVLVLAFLQGIAHADAGSVGKPAPVAIAYFEDPTGTLAIEQVASPAMAQRFAAVGEQDFNFGWTASAYWIRFSLPPSKVALVVKVATPYTDFLDFYRLRADGTFHGTYAGDRRPFSNQEFDYRLPAFRMEPSPTGETHFYLRARSAIALEIPLRFHSDEEFEQAQRTDNLRFGVYVGIVLALGLYNLFLYFGVRDRAYLWYVLWVVAIGVFQLVQHGFAFQWLLRDSAALADYAPYPPLVLAVWGLSGFVREVLDLKVRAPRLDVLMRTVAWLGWIVVLTLLFTDIRVATVVVDVQCGAGVLVSAIAALVVWRQNYRPARYLVLSMGLFWLCGLFAAAYHLGLVYWFHAQAHFFAYDGMMIASAIEVVLFAFALADRINLLKEAKESAQAAAIASQAQALAAAKRSEVELEQRVAKRTLALTLAKDEAQQASLAKTRFLAAASHDLRQPMHAIGLLVGALRERVGTASTSGLVDKIEASVEAMDDLFNALLDISRLDSGAVTAQPAEVSLQSVFERLDLTFAPQAESKGLRFKVRKTTALVRSDAVLLDRILSNLVANALRYTDQGGVLVAARVRGDSLRIEVRDSGPGIPADQQALVFEEFVQLRNPTRDRAKGLGLGLSIVKRAAGLQGHPLALSSAPGRGSVFAITVPLIARVAPDVFAASALAPAGEADLRGTFVVVIDDEPDILDGMTTLLAQFGVHVVGEASGPAAVAALAEHLRIPDLILCDYRIAADHTGVDAIAMIRDDQQAYIPALLVTGEAAADGLDRQSMHGLPLLRKPVSAVRLKNAMIAALGRGNAAPPAAAETARTMAS